MSSTARYYDDARLWWDGLNAGVQAKLLTHLYPRVTKLDISHIRTIYSRRKELIAMFNFERDLIVNFRREPVAELKISVMGEKVGQMKTVLDRALNTWDDAPKWLHDLSDQLNGVPERYSDRDSMVTNG